MNNSPSIYLPRQHRPRRTLSQNPGSNDAQNANLGMANTFIGATRASNSTPKQQPPAETVYSNSESTDRHTVAVSNSAGTPYSAISISGQLGSQIRRFREQASAAPINKVSVGAFLLGYAQGDGTIHLNMLDHGVLVSGKRIPTAAYRDDVVVPLFCGASKLDFYSHVFRHGGLYKVSGWISEQRSYSEMVVEFATTSVEMWVLVQTVLAANVGPLSSLVDDVRRDSSANQGSLTWNVKQGCYEYTNSLVIPPEHAVWITASNSDPNIPAGNAYLDAGAPHSLLVVQVDASASRSLQRTQTYRVEPSSTGKCTLHIQLGSVQFPESSEWSMCTAKLLHPDQYEKGIVNTLSAIAEKNGIVYSSKPTERGLVYSPKQYVSPFIQKIAAVTHPSADGDAFRIHTASDVKEVGAAGPWQMAELLEEQRNIRELLQEQNSLMRTQVSQAREMMRIMKRQPSPQTVTRRYLRMKGTHTPSLTDAHNPSIRRTNSLSEIVDGIRSFEVEGYEETEHHLASNPKQPTASFAMPVDADKNSSSSAIEPPATSAVSSGTISAGTSTGISSLVSRINNIVSTSDAAPKQSSTSFSRPPPMPGYHKQSTTQSSSYKITPTTQKYLESLERRQPTLPAHNNRRLSSD
ncbi:hypothetical protein IW138_001398 [Coemansia sp. RSA 986]|nr:hypothetical protein IW138_001398 [Coemansia sp. RSA 986]